MIEEELPPLPEVDNRKRSNETQIEYVARVRKEIDARKAEIGRRRSVRKTDADRKSEQSSKGGKAAKRKSTSKIIIQRSQEDSATIPWLENSYFSGSALNGSKRKRRPQQ